MIGEVRALLLIQDLLSIHKQQSGQTAKCFRLKQSTVLPDWMRMKSKGIALQCFCYVTHNDFVFHYHPSCASVSRTLSVSIICVR